MIPAEAKLSSETEKEEVYEGRFEVPLDFGEIGAVVIENLNENEMFVKQVQLTGWGSHAITCNSWVQPNSTQVPHQRRVFFTSKVTAQHTLPTLLSSFLENLQLIN